MSDIVVTKVAPAEIVVSGALRGIQGIAGSNGSDGINGTNGTNGSNGANGNTVLNGFGAPLSGSGVNGDFYIDTVAQVIYGPKASGAWPGSGTSLVGPPGSGDMILAVSQVVTASKVFNLNTWLDKGSMVYNVRAYGALGDDTNDDTLAIQAAADAAHAVGGGAILIPLGTHKITAPINMHNDVILLGNGVLSSLVKQHTANTDGFVWTDAKYVGVKDVQVIGTGSHTTNSGLKHVWSANGNVQQVHHVSGLITGFHYGQYFETLITSDVSDIECVNCDIGTYMTNGGTSVNFNGTYMNACPIGYYLDGVVYVAFNGTAADSNSQAYYLHNCAGISFNAAGCEAGVKLTAPMDGRGWFIDSCVGITFNAPWNYQNPSYAFYITNSSSITLNNPTENGPAVGATNGIFIDSNCARITIVAPNTTSTNNIQAGSNIVTLLSDVGGAATIAGALTTHGLVSPVTINGPGRVMILNANTDGGDYNIAADTTGVLAIFGSSAATLNVALLDGYLELDALTATTVPYLDANKRFVSSAVTPTQLGYLSGVTSAIQTQLGLLAPLISPSFTTPTLGVATATSINKVTITAPTTSATLTLVTGSSLITVGAFALTLTSTATSNATIPAGTNTLYSTKSASITSAQMLASMSDPTGTGASVFGTTPTIATPVINGLATGTGVASAATASTLVSRDANANLFANNLVPGFTTTATAAGTTTMAIGATEVQIWTGATTQTVKLPTTSVVAGLQYTIINLSSGVVTVQSSGANTIVALAAGTSAVFTALVATPTAAADWNAQYFGGVFTSGKTVSFTNSGVINVNGKTFAVNNNLTLAGTDGTTMTFPTTSATLARTDAANTFTGIQTVALLNSANQVITVTTNAGTADINHALQTFTNSSAAAMTVTLTTGAADGQFKEVRIYDFSAVAQTITWVNTENSTVTAPTTSNGSTTLPLSVLFQYNAATSKWRCIASV